MQQQIFEKRSSSRTDLYSYHCIEVQTLKMLFKYQFKIWDISSHGICLLVKSDSEFLNKVSVGEILDINYFPSDLSWPPDVHQTKIMHITRANHSKFKEHFLVGLKIANATSQDQES